MLFNPFLYDLFEFLLALIFQQNYAFFVYIIVITNTGEPESYFLFNLSFWVFTSRIALANTSDDAAVLASVSN